MVQAGAPSHEGVMYTAHFGLTEPPFSMTPDPRYVYMSERHREALAHLIYGSGEGGGFVQLTGEIGTGKTTLCRCLLGQLPPRVNVAVVLNPRLTDIELLATVCDELRIPYPPGTTSRKLLVDVLYRHLLDAHAQGQRTVLILDEAQDLAPEVLEQIRLLTNLETPTRKLLQIILIGQPELIRLLEREDLRQLSQRVTARYHLLPFFEEDTRGYIRHRMSVAGQKGPVFTEAAVRQVHQASRGVPRLINAICDRALLGAYTQDEHRVSSGTVSRATAEVLGHPPAARLSRSWQWAGAAIAAAALITGVWVVLTHGQIRLDARHALQGWSRPAAVTSGSAVPVPAATSPAPPTAGTAGDGQQVRAPASPVQETAPTRLGLLLADPMLPADKKSAFKSLYARWQLDFDGARNNLGCERGRAEGLQCLFKTGSWGKLRRFNLPAIIELTTPSGDRRYATVVALSEAAATLDFGGRTYAFPLSEIDRYWEGPFILLSRSATSGSAPILPGTRSRDVEWVKQRLAELDGTPVPARNRDLFDDELRSRVLAFQRSRSLLADGIVGEETLTHLSTGQHDPRVPRLWGAGP